MRVETRAVNRALRKAYGIGICSVEEIGSVAEPSKPKKKFHRNPPTGTTAAPKSAITSANSSASISSIGRWSEAMPPISAALKLCAMPHAERVETFVTHLADWAEKDRNALLCQLNSYLGQKEEDS